MTSCWAIYKLSIGYLRIEHRDQRLTLVQMLQREPLHFGEADEFCDRVAEQLSEYLRGERCEFDLEIATSGCTPFQQRVLEQLRRIPYGQTRTYKEIAEAIGSPRAARAVGMANNHNPIQIIIPCHRVVGSSGRLVGYAAGIETKSRLLEIERTYDKATFEMGREWSSERSKIKI
ncbi:MAG: methylated-DNA--[protein]-cysteine S-methyltransferase [Rikenellaceae bacterium]